MNVKTDKKTISRQVGLEIASICGKHFLNLDDLHYGYWPGWLKVDISNIRTAQENYTKFLLSHIPEGVKTILDVGCGKGHIARKLIDAGFKVDGVSPSHIFAEEARELLGNSSEIFECFYEQFQTEKKYDLVMFSESFQYINPEEAIKKTLSVLNAGGFLLISDIFKNDVAGTSRVSGGHGLKTFYKIVSAYPLEQIKDIDITEQTAPNIDIEEHIFSEVVYPVAMLVDQVFESQHPHISRFIKWKYQKKIKKIYDKYFSGQRTGENFKKFKTYRLMLYKSSA
jgi:SAM-dependent methyltransferase